MKPIDYLRGVMLRTATQPPEPKTEPAPPREIPWTNATHMSGTCPHLAIYRSCSCDLRKPTAQ